MALTLQNELFGDMDRMFEGVLNRFFDQRNTWPALSYGQTYSTPMDVVEQEGYYEITADCPGYAHDEISLEQQGTFLTISGERKQHNEKTNRSETVYRKERRYSKFSRCFTLPENVDSNNISASLDKGVLKVRLPKLEVPKPPAPRRITIENKH